MVFLFLNCGLLLLAMTQGQMNSLSASTQPDDIQIRQALAVLSGSNYGKALLQRAQTQFKLSKTEDLLQSFRWGKASRTDAVLTRHYNPKTGEEQRERRVTIYLREGQNLQDLVLDIAHELVHATSQPAWDPYDPKLTAGKYIWAAIEGEGGEVDAVVAECSVSLEIPHLLTPRCRSYSHRPGIIDREKVRLDFYRVGKWAGELKSKLNSEAPFLSLLNNDEPKLYSSTGQAPYPVALLHEFTEITKIACENSRRRLGATLETRSPASTVQRTAQFLSSRCNSH